jgi:hypothetical protein
MMSGLNLRCTDGEKIIGIRGAYKGREGMREIGEMTTLGA